MTPSVMEGGEAWLPREYRASAIFAHMREKLAEIDRRNAKLADDIFTANLRAADNDVWIEAYRVSINELKGRAK